MKTNEPAHTRENPLENQIKMFFHCGACLNSLPAGTSPRDWNKLEIGWTEIGIQVWCKRHDMNVMHIDFEGHKHPATMNAKPRPTGVTH